MKINKALLVSKFIPSYITDAEKTKLFDLAREAKGDMVEVGCCYGASTAMLLLGNEKDDLYVHDDFSWSPVPDLISSPETLREHLKMVRVDVFRARIVNGDSRITGKQWNKPISLLWIDGGHSYEFVRSDLECFGKFAEVIALHDYGNPAWATVEAAVNDYIKQNPQWFISEVVDTLVVLRQGNFTLKNVFENIFENNLWAEEETRSGGGSKLSETVNIRKALPEMVESLGITSLLDAGCGDWNWMSKIDWKIPVTGIDIVTSMIEENREKFAKRNVEFYYHDFCTIPIRKFITSDVSAILCRTVLFHLSFMQIHKALQNFKESGAKYLIMTQHYNVTVNEDAKNGSWRRLNFCLLPFNMPEPTISIQDGSGNDGYLCVWNLQE